MQRTRFGEMLSAAGLEFREIWAEHKVKDKRHGHYRYRHPLVGEIDLTYETLRLPDDPGLALTVHTAEEGSPAQTGRRRPPCGGRAYAAGSAPAGW
jgi:hypothetical protein